MALTTTNFVQDQIDELNSTLGIEYGSNSNGYWYKFPGGLLVQYGKNVKSTNNTGASRTVPIIFPIAFVDSNITLLGQMSYIESTNLCTVVQSIVDSDSDGTIKINNINNNTFTAYVYADWFAIGRWQ